VRAFLALELQPERGEFARGIRGLELHGMKHHAIAAEAACITKSQSYLR
jgi:hypothetical protein